MFKIITILTVIASTIFALNNNQKLIANQTYKLAKKYHTNNGLSFERTLCAIYLRESSLGINVIGDHLKKSGVLKSLYASSIGVGQIRVETVLFVLKNYPLIRKKWNLKWHSYDITKKYIKLIERKKYYSNLKLKYFKLYQKFKTIKYKELYNTHELIVSDLDDQLKKYSKYIETDNRIINLLFSNLEFSVDISTHYLIYNYEYAKKLKIDNPYRQAISRYNGGWNNYTYINKVLKNLKYVDKLIRKGIIK